MSDEHMITVVSASKAGDFLESVEMENEIQWRAYMSQSVVFGRSLRRCTRDSGVCPVLR